MKKKNNIGENIFMFIMYMLIFGSGVWGNTVLAFGSVARYIKEGVEGGAPVEVIGFGVFLAIIVAVLMMRIDNLQERIDKLEKEN